MTISVKRRAFLVFVALAFLGWLAALTGNPFSAGFGLGLFFPGSGFVYTGQWLLLLLTLVLFALAFFVWFASGNILAPAGIWLGAALAAGLFAREMPEDELSSSAVWLVPTIVVLLGTWIQVSGKRTYRKRLETLESRNSYLSATTFEPVPAPAYDENYWGELSLDDLKALRFNLDRALQPLDEFNGFEWHEFQFQFAAVRYQLNYLNYGLHVYQQRYAPNFHGYLNQGQRNLIEKALNKRVWGYWRWEALWGQLTTDFDPFRKENIMLSGWWGVNVAAYTSNTGDQRYMEPGSLTFRYNEVQYPYDLGRIAEAVHRNHTESDWCLYACEPNWVYNMCNESGMTLLMQYDKMYGTDYFSSLEQRFFENIQNEFTTADGRVIALRSQRIGFSVPLLTSPTADAQFGLLASPLQSQLAQRVWKILRTDLSRIKPDGEVEIDTQGWDEIDGGNYRPSNISTYLNVRMIAREMGDEEMADAIERTMKNQHDFRSDAELNYFADGSVMANAMYVLGNLLKKNGWHDFIKYTLPENITSGPLLEECEYPQVLVAKAVSHDGEGLELVLYPGSEQTNQVIGIARLQPGKQYSLSCGDTAEIYEADDEGKLRCEITLENRTEIQLTPA